jgi:hypothetical protein
VTGIDLGSASVTGRAPSREAQHIRVLTEHQQPGAMSLLAGACICQITGYSDITPFSSNVRIGDHAPATVSRNVLPTSPFAKPMVRATVRRITKLR